MEPLRVCLVTLNNPYFQTLDGVAKYTYFLSINLARLGCETHVLGLSKNVNKKKSFIQKGVIFHCLPDFKGNGEPLRLLFFLKVMSEEILALSKEKRFDVVHGQGGYSGPIAFAKRRGLRCKCVATIHTVGFNEQIAIIKDYWRSGFSLAGLLSTVSMPPNLIKFYGKFVYNQMDMNISVCEYQRRQASHVYNIPSERIITVSSGVDVTMFKNRGEHFQQDYPVILYVGRLAPRKGVQYLLLAMTKIIKEVPKAKLTIVGDGPFRKYLKDLSENLGIQNSVIFLGTLHDAELPKVYSSADVIVIPSLFEGLPLVLLEAMASGKPVVASAVGGIPEVIKHEFSGLLVRAVDVDGIANAVIHILQDKKFANYIAKNARRTILEKYDWKVNAKRMLEVYQKL